MARILALVLTGFALMSLAEAPAGAQSRGDSGSIVGYVVDQSGNPIRGVKVTATSATQIGGKKVAYTNDEGFFRFPVLDPGNFQVRTEAPKLKTQVQENVKVGITAAAEINVVMEVATEKIEEVKVVEKAPLISTSSSSVKEVYDIDFVDSMPHDNRDVIFQQLPNYSAGTINGRIRGGNTNQTIYSMDGFNLFHEYPTVKASAAYEIQTAGYGADNVMAPGGVVNMVSRSGSNKFEFEIEGTADNDHFKLFRDSLDSHALSDFYIINPTISGPIIKDRLWYSLNVEFLTQKTGRDSDPQGILPDVPPELRNWYKGTAKVTWQVTGRNKLSSVFTFDDWWRFYANGLGTSKEAQYDSHSKKYFAGLIWESVLTDSVVFRSQAGVAWANTENYPDRCKTDPNCDFVSPTIQLQPNGPNSTGKSLLQNNSNTRNQTPGLFYQAVNRLEFFSNNKATGEHQVQLKDNLQLTTETRITSMPGDAVFEVTGQMPTAKTTYYSNDPRYDTARYGWYITSTNTLKNALSLTDSWKPTRYLTVSPGVAFTTAKGSNNHGDQVLSASVLTPSLSVAWDATHDGRTVLRGSFSEYLDVEFINIAGQTLGSQVSQRCQWDDVTQNYTKGCVYSGGYAGATVGSPCGPSGIDAQGNKCQQDLTVPKTWEVTAGGEREVLEGFAVGEDFVYRRYDNQFASFETNRVWNVSGTDVTGYRNGRATTVSDLETPDSAMRRYVGLTTTFSKREGRMKLQAAYTWSRLRGTVGDGGANLLGTNPGRDQFLYGALPDDHTHEIKLNMQMHLTNWLSLSMRYSYNSGTPYNRFYYNSVTNKFDNLGAQVGINPNTNVNDRSDDRALRLLDQHNVNAQLAFNFQPLIGAKFETFIDVLNVLNSRTDTAVTTNDGPNFGLPTGSRMASTRIRLGARYRY
jgi:hypothetical protein